MAAGGAGCAHWTVFRGWVARAAPACGSSALAGWAARPPTAAAAARPAPGPRSGAHGKGVTAMLPLASEAPGGPDRLLTAAADGSVAVWDPSRSVARGPDREMAAQHTWKAHDGGVAVRRRRRGSREAAQGGAGACPSIHLDCVQRCSSTWCGACDWTRTAHCPQPPTPPPPPLQAMTFFLSYTEKPDAPVPRLATTGVLGHSQPAAGGMRPPAPCSIGGVGWARRPAAQPYVGPDSSPCCCHIRAGEDKRVHMWELGSWKPFAKAQPLQKAVCHSIGWAPWGGTGLGLHPSLLLATGARAGRAGAASCSCAGWRRSPVGVAPPRGQRACRPATRCTAQQLPARC